MEAADLKQAIIVGWSYGATIARRYATTHPEKVRGLVLLDGAYPICYFADAEGQQSVRTQFRRLAPLIRIAALLGKSARMSATQTAEALLEMDATNGTLGADYAALACPTAFVFATGGHSGTTAEEMEGLRAKIREQLKGIEKLDDLRDRPRQPRPDRRQEHPDGRRRDSGHHRSYERLIG
jgi:pimeloyl-ACP methyl ester carboxylesterase